MASECKTENGTQMVRWGALFDSKVLYSSGIQMIRNFKYDFNLSFKEPFPRNYSVSLNN